MPFDLASLEYAPLRRLIELASPFELVKLKRFGLQHSLTEQISNVKPFQYFALLFEGQKILLRNETMRTLSQESCPVFLTSTFIVCIGPNVEKIDATLVNRVIMQPERIILSEFTFNEHSFIFSHPCRRFGTKLTLDISNNYTFVGGEFSLIAEAFPAMEELTIDYNHPLLDWIDSLIESPLKKSSKLLVTVKGWTLPSMEGYKRRFIDLFENANPGFKLKFDSKTKIITTTVSTLHRLGFSVHVSPYFWNEPSVFIEIHKELNHASVSIPCSPTLPLDKFHKFKLGYKGRVSDYFDLGIPEILMDCSMLTIEKTTYKSKLDQRFLNKRLRFETTILHIEKCELDNDVVVFTKPFAHQVKYLAFKDVHLPNNTFMTQLIRTFPAVEKLEVWQLPANGIELLMCNNLSQLKSISFNRNIIDLLPKYLKLKADAVKVLFTRAHSSFHLQIDNMEFTFEKHVNYVDKIRMMGFEVILIDRRKCKMSCNIYRGIQEYIRLKSTAKEITIRFYDDRIVLQLVHDRITSRNVEITADSPRIQLTADRVVFKATGKSFKVAPEVRNKLVIQPTVVKLLNCVNEDFFELAEQFAHSVKHLDLRSCVCKKTHFKKQKKRIRQVFPNLIKLWDI